jgi:hypothetical protein
MIFRLRYKDVKAVCAEAALLCETDARLIDKVNQAQEMLLTRGKWVGTVRTFRFCVPSHNCIVWPREIETPEAVAVCKQPIVLRSAWYEFAENGFGEIGEEDNLFKTLIDRGEVCAFDEVVGTNKKLAVYADKNGNTGKYIWLEFFDANGNFVRTNVAGVETNGERIAIPNAGQYNYTTNVCMPGGLVRVKKDITVGVVRLFQYDTVTTELKPLAYYQPDEEVPAYRSSLIPSLRDAGCTQTPVTVRAKLRFIPARNDESFLMIPSMRALKLAVKAVKKEDDDLTGEADTFLGMALSELQAQSAHHTGSGERNLPQTEPAETWGAGITNLQ